MRKYIFKHSLKFGLLAALACFLFFLLLYFVGPNPLQRRRPDIGLNAIMIWAGIWYFKRNNGGYLHFYQGFSIGFLINIFAAFFSGLLLFLFITYIDAEPLAQWISSSKATLLKDKDVFVKIINEDNFNRQMDSISNSKPYQLIFDDLMFKQLAIVPITLLSLLLRKIDKL